MHNILPSMSSAVVPVLLQLHFTRETCPGSGSDPCVRWHLLRNVLYKQQVFCQAPPSQSVSRNGVGLVFLLPFGIPVLKRISCPLQGVSTQQEAAVEARGERSTDPAGQGRGQGQARGCWGEKGEGLGKGKGSNWDPRKSTVQREEAVQSLRAVKGEAKGGISNCFVYLYIFPLFATVATGTTLSRLIPKADV